MSEDETSTYKVFWFRDGRKEIGRVDCETAAQALAWAKAKEDEWLGVGRCPIVETTLTVLPSPRTVRGAKQQRVTHTLEHLERKQPNVVFVCVMESGQFKKKGIAADTGMSEERNSRSRRIKWDDLPAEWKNRIRKTESDCWLWLTSEKEGPYLDVYRRMKGPVPEGVPLCHSCGNPRCVNPEHLTEASQLQNGHYLRIRASIWRQPYRKSGLIKR
jgi:hypothetical protein